MEQTPKPPIFNGKDMLHACFQLPLWALIHEKSASQAKNRGNLLVATPVALNFIGNVKVA
jgi:hypothetical protein